jgi:cellulose synthase/poly-beta-1,6-N-acetylglucosamine synthase-like glycosyltransferase
VGTVGITLYILASTAFFLDLVDLLVRLYLRREHTSRYRGGLMAAPTSVPLTVGSFTPYEMKLHTRPFAIVVSVYNASSNIGEFLTAMAPFRDQIWVIDDASSDDTTKVIQAAGFRCVRAAANRHKPGALKALLAELPATVESVIVMDPDARILTPYDEFVQVIFEFQQSGMAAMCPRIAAAGSNWLAHIQRLEYCLAFSVGRKSLANFSITSGVAVYRRDALEGLLNEHSLSAYAEDLENALILLAREESIYYDGRLLVETDAVMTVRRLFSQRVGWYFGLMRVYATRWRSLWRRSARHPGFAYQYLVYIGGFVVLLHPLKLVGLALLIVSALNGIDNLWAINVIPDLTFTNPFYFQTVYLQYVGLMLLAWATAVGRRERWQILPIVPLYPLYALAHIVPSTVGYINWFTVRLWGRRVYRDHYQPAMP